MVFGASPFDFFGGHPGMQQQQQQREPADTTAHYKTLGVAKGASESEIRTAFRKSALKAHPDRGGDRQKFQEINEAYEVLSDAEKKKAYDQGGADAVAQPGQRSNVRRGKDIKHDLQVSLEDCYNGKVRKLAVTRNALCKGCDGKGGKEGCEVRCNGCRGQGVVIKMRQLGPGMCQQVQAHCDDCQGQGVRIDPRLRCLECKGKKVAKERKVLEVSIDKGLKSGSKIKFRGESDQAPDCEPGDIVFDLKVKDHPRFTRKGQHLFMTKQINLTEALCGTSFAIELLDGRTLTVSTKPGEVIAPNAAMQIEGEGMPLQGNPFAKGRLVIKFAVEFPSQLTTEQVAGLQAMLPQRLPPPPAAGENAEAHEMHPFDEEAAAREYESNREAYDSDEEEEGRGGPGGGQNVQCAQG